MIKTHFALPKYRTTIFWVLALPVLYFISRGNYNLFHSLVDGVSIVIAASVFTIIWNGRRMIDNHYFLYIGISLLFFAFLDLMHVLGNKNMGVFPEYGNLGPALYIASRYILSISLMIAPLFINRKLNTTFMFVVYSLVTLFILLSIFYWHIFPVCIVEGVGLTPFKVVSDYIICLILLGAAGLLIINRRTFDSRVLWIIVFSIILFIATGLSFTLYSDPFGIMNMVGHFFQVASFYLLYIAFIETSLNKPQEILYRKLKQSEEELSKNLQLLDYANVELKQEITEHKQTEEELEKTNLQLEEASRLKSQFLANMSHELRSPLNSIIGFTGIILQGIVGELNTEQNKQLGMVYDSAKHLLGLINDILDLSKIEAGKIEIKPAEFELKDFIQQVGKMVSPLIDERGLTLEIVLSEDLPLTLYNDKNRIKQVLINLLSNAIKFTEKGKIRLEAGMLAPEEGSAASTIAFHVSDTGIGIKPDNIQDIFDEFKQIEGSLKDKPAGTGLGLAISKRMVEMMGGKIWVDSTFGKGSVFHITIPCQLADAPRHPPAVLQNMSPDKSKKLILTIDDEIEAQEILKIYLKTEGYEVIQAYNSMEAIQLAKKYQPFAITLDIIMPGKDGWDILKELKDHPETKEIPVICISMLDNRELGLSLGAFNYLVKPVGKEQFINELQRIEKSYTIYDVLIIDDDPKAVALIARYLGAENGYVIRKAYGGKQGLEKISEQLPDLVILDLMMPDVDGFEVLGHLKESETTKHIPIIIVSGKTLTQEEINFLNEKIVSIINKHAFGKEELLRDIKKTLDNMRTRRR